MKTFLIALIFFLIGITSPHYSQIKAMTFNIRYDNPDDGENSWENRKAELVDMINSYHPDFLGLQEGLLHQLKYISSRLNGFSMIGVGRDGKNKGEFSALFYDTLSFKLIEGSTFWLSENEDTISIGWDAAFKRICTYGLFADKKSGQKIWVFNTHYDHIGEKAREMSSKLILRKINELNKENYPLILMGDFNTEPESVPIKILKEELTDGLSISQEKFSDPIGTFNNFEENPTLKSRIDYIFVKNLEVINYRHLSDRRKNNLWPSDHLPVFVEIKFISKK